MSRNLDTLGSEDLVPTVNRDAAPDFGRVGPADWSVLGLVDGRRSLGAICKAASLAERDVIASLKKLCELDMIRLPAPQGAISSPALATPGRGPSGIRPARNAAPSKEKAPEKEKPRKGSVRIPPPKGWPVPFDRFSFDEATLGEAVDLDDAKRRQILYWHAQLEHVDFYTLFQVERSADERGLRRAYFGLSKEFHPDQFFRRELGSYEVRIGEIFKWIAGAYATLSDADKRRRYDALLARGLKGEWELERPSERGPARPVSDEVLSRSGASAAQPPSSGPPPSAPGADAKLEEARRRMEAGRWADAYALLEPLLSPNLHPRAAVAAARCLLELGERLEAADDLCRRALKASGLTQLDKRDAMIVLGGLFEHAGRLDDARKLLLQAQRLDPRNTTIRDHLERLDRHRAP